MPLTVLVMLALLAPQPKATRTPRPTATPTPYPTAKMEKLLAGNWECVAACPEESIAFALQGAGRSFSSWLRDRPAVVGGRWQLDEGRITITKSDAVIHTWDIVTLSRVRLEVKGSEPDKPNAVYRRSMR
jgi:hypothetical protein